MVSVLPLREMRCLHETKPRTRGRDTGKSSSVAVHTTAPFDRQVQSKMSKAGGGLHDRSMAGVGLEGATNGCRRPGRTALRRRWHNHGGCGRRRHFNWKRATGADPKASPSQRGGHRASSRRRSLNEDAARRAIVRCAPIAFILGVLARTRCSSSDHLGHLAA